MKPEDEPVGNNYENTKEALDKVNRVISAVQLQLANPALVFGLPGPVAVAAAAGLLENAKTQNDNAIREVAEYFAWSGRPDKLYSAAGKWSEIQEGVSKTAGLFTPNSMRADDRWYSLAADAYLQNFDPQKEALSAVSSKAGKMSLELTKLANEIRKFWSSVAAKATSLIDGLVSNVANPINAGSLIINTVSKIMDFIATTWDDVVSASSTFQEEASKITSIDKDLTAFPLGRWEGPSGDFYQGDWKPS